MLKFSATLSGTVVRQHHSAAAYLIRARGGGNRADQHFGTVAGETRRSMMLGNPIARVAETIGKTREIDVLRSASPAVEPSGIGD